MSTAIQKAEQPTSIQEWTPEQKTLVKRTVAMDATDDELAMFLHVAAKAGLDPLQRQIHFMKRRGKDGAPARVTIQAGIDGLQARAAREPDYEGLEHAVVYEKDVFSVKAGQIEKHESSPFQNGRIVGAWAAAHREGKRPFVAVVDFSEYCDNNNPLWRTKPKAMIDKVARHTALRMAYPEKFSGIYEPAEMDKADADEELKAPPPPAAAVVAANAVVDAEFVEKAALPEPAPHDNLLELLEKAASEEELRALVPKIQELPDDRKAEIRVLYGAKQRELKGRATNV